MKRILFVTGSMEKGGAERVISILSDYYANLGWDVKILMLLNSKIGYEINPQVQIIDISPFRKGKLSSLKLVRETRKTIKNTNPDVIVAFMGPIALITALANKGMKRRLIVSERIDPSMAHRKFAVRKLLNRVYAKSDCTVLQTRRAWNYFPASVRKNSVIIENPIRVQCYAKEDKSYRIVTAGRLTEQKNHKMLMNAFEKIHKTHPEYKLDIFGEGPLQNELQKLIKEKELQGSVTLAGSVSDLHNRMADAEIFVLSSDYEGLSNALLEAMMMGLACISTDCAGSDEAIRNGENGLLVPIGDTQKLAQAMQTLIENEELRNRLAKAAMQTSEKYRVDNIIQKWAEVIERT